MMKLQGSTPFETIRRIFLFLATIVVTFFVIFFLWIPLLIIVCIFLLFAFVFRKKMNITSFKTKRNVYATWNSSSQKDNVSQNTYVKSDYVDADYINLDNDRNKK